MVLDSRCLRGILVFIGSFLCTGQLFEEDAICLSDFSRVVHEYVGIISKH